MSDALEPTPAMIAALEREQARQPPPDDDPIWKGESVRVRVTPGAGGNDSVAWAWTLCATLHAWAARNALVVRVDADRRGFEAFGSGARDVFAGEAGVHRLVRVSPFDHEHRRTTSFASVTIDGDNGADGFAGQRRSYVMDPYTLAKDHATGREAEDVAAVLGGDLSLVRGG